MLFLQLRNAQWQLNAHRAWLRNFIGDGARNATDRLRRFSIGRGLRKEEDATTSPFKVRRLRGTRNPKGLVKLLEKDGTEEVGQISKAQQRKRERYENRKKGGYPVTAEDAALAIRQDFVEFIQKASEVSFDQELSRETFKDVVRLYNALPERRPLVANDFRKLAQMVHQALRFENQKPAKLKDRRYTDEIIAFAEVLVTDIKRGNLVPSIAAHVHLLGIFNESGHLEDGIRFWKWLRSQDRQHTGTETYAVAIEILAIQGQPLSDLEDLYQEALTRFPGAFHAYHLSPEAIVPDRSKVIHIKNLPVGLLRSIVFARLLRGDSRGAYLGLDTNLRLLPHNTARRTFELFMQERSLSEAYIVFALASRAGINVSGTQFRQLLKSISACTKFSTAWSYFAAARLMIAVFYLQLRSSGSLSSNSLGEFIIGLFNVFRLSGMAKLESRQRKQLIDASLLTVRRTFEVFARHGSVPGISAFHSIITNLAGYGQSREVLGIVLKDMQALGIEPNEVTRRAILVVAGRLKDRALVESTWRDVLSNRNAQGQVPDVKDFSCLAKACRAINDIAYAEGIWAGMRDEVPGSCHSQIEYHLSKDVSEDSENEASTVDFDEIHNGFEKINADLAVIEESTREGDKVQDLSDQQIPLTMFQPAGALRTSEENMRRIYDEMTTDPSGPVPASSPSISSSTADSAVLPDSLSLESAVPIGGKDKDSTQISDSVSPRRHTTGTILDELRYEHWKAINHLLQLAEMHDSNYERRVDEAIAKGERPPPRLVGLEESELEELRGFGLSQPAIALQEKGVGEEVPIEAARAEILRLRGRV